MPDATCGNKIGVQIFLVSFLLSAIEATVQLTVSFITFNRIGHLQMSVVWILNIQLCRCTFDAIKINYNKNIKLTEINIFSFRESVKYSDKNNEKLLLNVN